MYKRLATVMFLASSCAAVSALAQGPPTGIQKVGSITLIRAEGKISLGPTPPIESTTDNGGAGFTMIDYTQYTPPTTNSTITTIGPCTVFTYVPGPSTPPPPVGITPLDAGPVININGPNGMKQIPKTMGAYFAMLGGGAAIPTPIPIPGLPGPTPLYLDPGTYTVDNGAGGADVGPFSVTLNVPSPGFVWTNADSDLTVVRSAGVDIQWTGGDPTTMVSIVGSVSIIDPTSFQVTGGGSFSCIVPNNGEFMVTSDVLSLLPASPTGGGPTSALGSTLAVANGSSTNFTATGLDMGLMLYTAGYSRSVVYQ